MWLAYLSGAFGLAISAQVNFLVPLRARELGAGFDVIGLIVGARALGPLFFSVTTGALIDRLGPRRCFQIGTACTAVVSLTFVLVTDYWWFLVLMPILGVVRNLGWVASQTYVTSMRTVEDRPRDSGRFSFFGNVGQLVGSAAVGGVAQLVGFRWALLFPAGYAAAFVLVASFLGASASERVAAPKVPQGTGLRSAVGLVAIRGIQVALLLTFARLWVSTIFNTFLPVYLVDRGLAPGIVGTVMATSGLVAATSAMTAGFWVRYASQPAAAALALASGASALLLAPHVSYFPVVYILPLMVGIGTGLSLPYLLSIVTTAAPPEKRGVALGLRGMANQGAGVGAPVLVGALIGGLGMALGFSVGGIVGLGALALSRLLARRDPTFRRPT